MWLKSCQKDNKIGQYNNMISVKIIKNIGDIAQLNKTKTN